MITTDKMPKAAAFFALWRAKQTQACGAIPARRAFQPHALAPFVAELVILDLSPEKPPRLRLIGTAFDHVFGSVSVGGNPFDLLDRSEMQLILPLHRKAQRAPCGFAITRLVAQSGGRKPIRLVATGLPVLDPDGTVTQFLIHYDGVGQLPTNRAAPLPYLLERHQYIDLGFGIPDIEMLFNMELTANVR